jgi:hypothetical protein
MSSTLSNRGIALCQSILTGSKRSNYKKENPDVKEAYYIKCYINGLKPEIKHYMKPLKPTHLYDVVEHARDMEQEVLANSASHSRLFSPVSQFQKQPYTQFKPRNTTEAGPQKQQDKPPAKPEPRYKEPNLCRYCGQKWFFGHMCQQYKTVNLMTAEEQTDPAEDELQDNAPLDEHDTPVTSPSTEEQLMQISLQAVQGKNSPNTFTLSVLIGGKTATALVDTGSTHTFIDLKFTTKINYKTVSNTLEKVLVAGGGELQTGPHVENLQYTIQGNSFQNSFKILPLKGYDIVLGGDWMLCHSPITFDYQKMKIRLNGQDKLVLQDETLKKGVQLMFIDKLHKDLAKGATGYCLFPITSAPTVTPKDDRELMELLQDFSDVFEKPVDLPPSRECDHVIPLKKDSEPPRIRPYRVPHKQS